MNKNTTYLVLILLALVLFSGYADEITGLASGKCHQGGDAGKFDPLVKGYARIGGSKWWDYCVDISTVSEAYCKKWNMRDRKNIQCQYQLGYECKDGACVLKQLVPIVQCTDTDWQPAPSTVCSGQSFTQTSNCGATRQSTGTKYCPPPCVDSEAGKDYYTPGKVSVVYGFARIYPDCCTAAEGGPCVATGPVLNETYCGLLQGYIGEIPMSEQYTCPNGCEKGACISTAEIPEATEITEIITKL